MTDQPALFEMTQAAPPSGYRVTFDPADPACYTCEHIRLAKAEATWGARRYITTPDRCALLRRDVDADFGVCGKYKARQE